MEPQKIFLLGEAKLSPEELKAVKEALTEGALRDIDSLIAPVSRDSKQIMLSSVLQKPNAKTLMGLLGVSLREVIVL